MADSKNFEVKFIIQALDQAAGVIQGVKNNLVSLGQTATQVGASASGLGNQIASGLEEAQKQAKSLQDKISDIGQSLAGMGLALAGAGASMVAPIALAVKSAGDFEHAMNKVKAVAEATPADFQKMNEFALEMGKSSVFSAKETAGGMLELARAGYKTSEVLATVPTVLKLAAVEEQNVGQVSENLVKILSSFGMGAEQAARAGDVLARTSNDSTTSMAGLSEALKFVAPIARAIGEEIERTSAFLGVLSNNGIDATMAGTGLRRVMERLMDPTSEAKEALFKMGVEVAKSADGNLDLYQTLTRLRDAHMTAAEAFKIFGVYGATGALILAQNVDQIDKFTKRNKEATDSLNVMNDITQSGTNAALKKLSNTLNELLVTLGTPFLNTVKRVVDWLASFVNTISSVAKAVPGLSFVLGSIGGVIGVLLVAFGGLALAAGGLLMGVAALGKGWAALTSLSWANIKAMFQSTTAHRAETAAIQAETQAVIALSKAQQQATTLSVRNQRIINQTPFPGQTPVPRPGQRPGSGPGKGEGGTSVSGALGLGIKGNLGMGIGLGAMGLALDQLMPKLSGTAGLLQNVATTGGELAINVGMMGGPLGIVVTGFTSWLKVIPQIPEALRFMKDDVEEWLPAWLTDIGRRVADVFNIKPVGKVDLNTFLPGARDFIEQQMAVTGELVPKSYDLLNTYLERWKEANPGKDVPVEMEQAFRKAFNEIVGGIVKAQKQVGHELDAIEKSGAKLTPAQRLQETKNFYDVEAKLLETNTKLKQTNLKIEEEAYKAQVASDIASAWVRAQVLEAAEIQAAAKRIQVAQTSHDERLALRQDEYNKLKALLEEEMKDGAKEAEAKKKLADLEKKQTEDKIAAQKQLTDAISAEITAQLKKREEHAKKIHDLEQQMKDAQIEGQNALVEINNKSISESGRTEVKFAQMADTLKQAADALPTMPEKAIQLAQQARGMANGLVQDIAALKNSFLTFQQSTSEGLLGIQKKGMSPYAAWVADLRIVESLQEQARIAAESGDLDQAQKLAAQAGQKAQGLANAPEGVNQAQAIMIASNAFVQAANLEREIRLAIIAREEANQKRAKEEAEKATKIQLAAIKLQIDTAENQITAIDENTKALWALKARIEQGIPTTQGKSGQPVTGGQEGTRATGDVVTEGAPFSMANDQGVVGPGTLNVAPATKFVPGYYSSNENQARIDELDAEKAAISATSNKLSKQRERIPIEDLQMLSGNGSGYIEQYDAKTGGYYAKYYKAEEIAAEQAAREQERLQKEAEITKRDKTTNLLDLGIPYELAQAHVDSGDKTGVEFKEESDAQSVRQVGLDSRWKRIADGIDRRKQAITGEAQFRLDKSTENQGSGGVAESFAQIIEGFAGPIEGLIAFKDSFGQGIDKLISARIKADITVNGQERGTFEAWQTT